MQDKIIKQREDLTKAATTSKKMEESKTKLTSLSKQQATPKYQEAERAFNETKITFETQDKTVTQNIKELETNKADLTLVRWYEYHS